jgi:hypothetical protein
MYAASNKRQFKNNKENTNQKEKYNAKSASKARLF